MPSKRSTRLSYIPICCHSDHTPTAMDSRRGIETTVVGMGRIELPTPRPPAVCSTSELHPEISDRFCALTRSVDSVRAHNREVAVGAGVEPVSPLGEYRRSKPGQPSAGPPTLAEGRGVEPRRITAPWHSTPVASQPSSTFHDLVLTVGVEPTLSWPSTMRLCQLGYVRMVGVLGIEPRLTRVQSPPHYHCATPLW